MKIAYGNRHQRNINGMAAAEISASSKKWRRRGENGVSQQPAKMASAHQWRKMAAAKASMAAMAKIMAKASKINWRK